MPFQDTERLRTISSKTGHGVKTHPQNQGGEELIKRICQAKERLNVIKALELMIKEDKGRVVVIEKDRIIGLITRNGIGRYEQIKGK